MIPGKGSAMRKPSGLRKRWLKNTVAVLCALALVCALAVTVVFAKFIGCTLPILAKKLGFDPAVMASPFITTLVDALSLLVYFKIATIMLGI